MNYYKLKIKRRQNYLVVNTKKPRYYTRTARKAFHAATGINKFKTIDLVEQMQVSCIRADGIDRDK